VGEINMESCLVAVLDIETSIPTTRKLVLIIPMAITKRVLHGLWKPTATISMYHTSLNRSFDT